MSLNKKKQFSKKSKKTNAHLLHCVIILLRPKSATDKAQTNCNTIAIIHNYLFLLERQMQSLLVNIHE